MTLSTDNTVAVISLLVSAPCTAIMVWRCLRRGKKSILPSKQAQSIHASKYLTMIDAYTYSSEMSILENRFTIYAPFEAALEAGLILPHETKRVIVLDASFCKWGIQTRTTV